MRTAARRLLSSTRTVLAASLLSLALGLLFLFVWAPHPWGRLGFDHYHELGLTLARGGEFPTTDVPWGYAYFLALFYRTVGPILWVPLLVQVIANACIPWLIYRLVRPLADRRIAVASALLTGALSFNTVYASTQSSDAVCTTLFVLGVLILSRGWQSGRAWPFAVSGLLAGLVPQFRPNLILLPIVAAGLYVVVGRQRRHVTRALTFVGCAAVALAPWTIRNYVLTGELLPTSTHGGVQLWYGTLQTREHLHSRAYNPRSAFEAPAFDYTSTTRRPIVVTAYRAACAIGLPGEAQLTYWTDRLPARVRVEARTTTPEAFVFEVPAQGSPTVVRYFIETRMQDGSTNALDHVPIGGAANPLVFFVATDHLGDLDLHGDLLDAFDIVRIIRAVAWGEPPAFPTSVDVGGNGRVDETDLRAAVEALRVYTGGGRQGAGLAAVESRDDVAVARFTDGSTLQVSRAWSGRLTDVEVQGRLAGALVYARVPFAALRLGALEPPSDGVCRMVERVAVNEPFHLREPHLMRRYTALAFDNIRRDPVGFLLASAYRMGQLFIIRGSDDAWTAQQFTASRLIYLTGFALSASYFLAFVAGLWIAWRRRNWPLLALAVPILYVPLTIGFVLTNMRYTVTVQPLVFVFVATALVHWLEWLGHGGGRH